MPVKQPAQLTEFGNPASVYADNLAGIVVNQGNFSMTFAAIRANHTKAAPSNARNVAVRLIMPTTAIEELHAALGRILKELSVRNAAVHAQKSELHLVNNEFEDHASLVHTERKH